MRTGKSQVQQPCKPALSKLTPVLPSTTSSAQQQCHGQQSFQPVLSFQSSLHEAFCHTTLSWTIGLDCVSDLVVCASRHLLLTLLGLAQFILSTTWPMLETRSTLFQVRADQHSLTVQPWANALFHLSKVTDGITAHGERRSVSHGERSVSAVPFSGACTAICCVCQ